MLADLKDKNVGASFETESLVLFCIQRYLTRFFKIEIWHLLYLLLKMLKNVWPIPIP